LFDLPGGGKARICVKRDMYPDGTTFVGTGIVPDIHVPMKVEDVREGKDPVLERAALELLTH
jgi:carboxyl-terminal processing protease